MNRMLVVMAGLPGTGKSAIAERLAPLVNGVVLNKDAVRAALFAPDAVEYSAAQDDFVVSVLLQAADYLFRHQPGRPAVLDGRTFAETRQLRQVMDLAAGVDVRVIECVCRPETAIARIESQQGVHPAANRTAALYRRRREAWEPIHGPKLVVDTEQPLALCVEQALAYLRLESIMRE